MDAMSGLTIGRLTGVRLSIMWRSAAFFHAIGNAGRVFKDDISNKKMSNSRIHLAEAEKSDSGNQRGSGLRRSDLQRSVSACRSD